MSKMIPSFLILFVMLFGVITADKSFCLESTTESSSLAATDSHESHADAQTADCHHENSACHTCHLGHCAFTISSSINSISQLPISQPVPSDANQILSTYLANLLRPPIS